MTIKKITEVYKIELFLWIIGQPIIQALANCVCSFTQLNQIGTIQALASTSIQAWGR